MIPAPELPVFEERRPENELLSPQDLEEMFLEEQLKEFEMYKRKDIGGGGYDPEDSDSPEPSPRPERVPKEQRAGRPREPLSQQEAQLIGSYIELKNTTIKKNRTPEQTDLFNRGYMLYKSKKRNHPEEVDEIVTRMEELINQEGRNIRKKK